MAQKPNASTPQSMLEGLQMILGELGSMMAAPDADVNFLTQLQHALVAKIKQGTQQALQQQQQSNQQAMGGQGGGQPQHIQPGGGAGMSGFNAAQQMGAGGGGGGGGMNGPSGMPNPDEFRRVMGGGQAA